MQSETRFKIKVMQQLKLIPNLWVVKVAQKSVRGTPDLLICYKGSFFAWELKTGTSTTKLQQHTLDLINKAGGQAVVVTPSTLDYYLEEMKDYA